jgi:4-diphosphocytidyl-2-C-methyl-D-erythritol kinase
MSPARGVADVSDAARPSILRFAPAKLNLTLAVTGRRDDGYHALHSVMVPLALGDAVAVRPDPAAGADSLRIAGLAIGSWSAGPQTEPDAANLVLRAIAATRAAVRGAWPGAPASPPALAARLTKRIPVAAGLGGGSSDAAATVAAALEAWGATLPFDALAALASSLGSDVPFFLAGGPALVTGRGEFVEPLPAFRGEAPAVLIVTPRLPVSTPAVFATFDAATGWPAAGWTGRGSAAGWTGRGSVNAAALAASERLASAMRAGLTGPELLTRAGELAAANDLLPATLVVAPSLAPFREALAGVLGRPIGQSGSGPTAWALYGSLAAARKAARFLRLAIREGRLPAVGDGHPFIEATTVAEATIGGTSGHAAAPEPHNGGRSTLER